jgi:lysosomal Pro-X carboxypeptidase
MTMGSRPSTWTDIQSIFNTCTEVESAKNVTDLYIHLSNGYQYMTMTDYPYEANFLEPMPAFPVKVAAAEFNDIPVSEDKAYKVHQKNKFSYETDEPMTDRETELLTALAASTNVYFNYTGEYPCTDMGDVEGTGSLDGAGWNVLACNQLAMPIGYGEDSMFIPQSFDYEAYEKMCQ